MSERKIVISDDTPLESLPISTSLATIFFNWRGLIETVGDVRKLTDSELKAYRNLGSGRLKQLRYFAPYKPE